MLALSVRFPAVAWIAQGRKTIEVRSWPTRHRGRLLIVSSKLSAADARHEVYRGVPSGCMVAVVDLVDCQPMRRKHERDAWCASGPGLYAWSLRLRHHTTAAPVTGRVRFFHVADDTIRRARAPAWLYE